MKATRAHGDYLTYIHDRCRCDDCRRAWNVYNQGVKLRHQRGETVSVDRSVVRTHILDLQDSYGATTMAIARAAGYGNNSVVRNALDAAKTRPVPASAARRILAVTYDSLPDDALVSADLALEQLDRLRGHGVSHAAIARRLGWSGWPGVSWPRKRVQAGTVRTLRSYADELDARCEECDQPGWGGGRWCWTHYSARATPVTDNGCGTTAGYAKHRRAGETPCRSCKDAQAAYNRHRSAA